jgi:hypothetical protein
MCADCQVHKLRHLNRRGARFAQGDKATSKLKICERRHIVEDVEKLRERDSLTAREMGDTTEEPLRRDNVAVFEQQL